MSKLGTCRHSHQIQEMWRIAMRRQPHEPAEEHVLLPEEYTCQWLDTAGDLPPPIKRRHGGFDLRAGDCDECARFQPPDVRSATE